MICPGPSQRASTRSFIRFQAGAEETRNGAQIISFLAPYICEECDAEREFELTPTEAKAGPKEPPRQCVECKSEMVLRDPAAIYFAFLQA